MAPNAPANLVAARLYAEGLQKLRVFDAIGAREVLEKAEAADSTYAMAHSALSDAWSTLGYDTKGQDEAKRAFDLAGGLPREQSMWIEGRYYQATRKWDQAVEIYRTLLTFFPTTSSMV